MSELIVVYLMNFVWIGMFAWLIRSINKGQPSTGASMVCIFFTALASVVVMFTNYNNLVEFAPAIIKLVGETSDTVVNAVTRAAESFWELIQP